MRPIRRGASPITTDFNNYQDAQLHLITRLGKFCSYCERPIITSLAVEHIQPKKGPYGKPELEGQWDNFLLACVNCNSIKGSKQVLFTKLFFPDRDNTFLSFVYTPDGRISESATLTPTEKQIATNTLKLTGLDRRVADALDENGELVALDRITQRMEAWGEAQVGKLFLDTDSTSIALRKSVIRTAYRTGCFSVWMTVFSDDIDMRKRLIQAFDHAGTGNYPDRYGTEASGCFDPVTTEPISPAPNPDELDDGGKI